MMFRRQLGVCLGIGWLSGVLWARTVTQVLWISSGGEGWLVGGDREPGFAGVAAYLSEMSGCWLDVGGTRDWDGLQQVDGLRLPDAVVPSPSWRSAEGQALFTREDIPLTLLNTAILPQFDPEKEALPPRSRTWADENGVRIKMTGLWSGKVPLRVPLGQLQPCQVMDPEAVLRAWMIEQAGLEPAFRVVVLPEGVDGSAWSRESPGIPLVVEPPSGEPAVTVLDDGARLRVRPGARGRALIRVDVRWDTVDRTFLPPLAEVVWMRMPPLGQWQWPDDLADRLRPARGDEPLPTDWVLCPEGIPQADARLVDQVWGGKGNNRQVWMTAWCSAAEAQALRSVDLEGADWRKGGGSDLKDGVSVRLPAAWAAGLGGDALALRQKIDALGIELKVAE